MVMAAPNPCGASKSGRRRASRKELDAVGVARPGAASSTMEGAGPAEPPPRCEWRGGELAKAKLADSRGVFVVGRKGEAKHAEPAIVGHRVPPRVTGGVGVGVGLGRTARERRWPGGIDTAECAV